MNAPCSHKQYSHNKYRPFTPIALKDRRWPDRQITAAPRWCSVDLRDGNQALMEPMTVTQKSELFDLLVAVGFKEIEVGFPAASQPDYDFVRKLIEEDRIPTDVTIQVLTQARPELIERSFDALRGCRRAIVHLYNSTSTIQRELVFKMDRAAIKAIAVDGARAVADCAARHSNSEWQFQYSPESFTGTELDFAVEVCDAVNAVWQPTTENPVIINLPSTVEMATPNVYADQIEWFCRNIANREAVTVSLHTHNDRGCGVAAAELGVMAGADRVEGTLLGNGERTGNMCVVTMALNLYSQGVNPQLDLSDMDEVIRVVKQCTRLPVHPRHPYAGKLVFTAFSGSHQDAIKKCLDKHQPDKPWQVAYLPIDPRDLGRSYEEIIRINSQSGKGGIAYILEQEHGYSLPRSLQIEFSTVVQRAAESSASLVTAEQIGDLFKQHYLRSCTSFSLESYQLSNKAGVDKLRALVSVDGRQREIATAADGSLAAFVKALSENLACSIDILDYSEHAIGCGVDKQAIAYLQVRVDGRRYHGVAINQDIMAASFNAVLQALKLALREQPLARA